MTSPKNTSRTPHTDWLFGGNSDAILNQEAEGQRQLLQSTVLPVDIGGHEPREFEALGFTFGAAVDGDPLFREATLPDGWKREGTEHSMWTIVVDERGLERIAVFYKAAFYDRHAHMNIVNVGVKVASNYIYGDAAEPDLHPELTPAELADAREEAGHYLERVKEYPDIYGDRAPRADKLIEALERSGTP